MPFTQVEIVGTYLTPDGAAARGEIRFQPTAAMFNGELVVDSVECVSLTKTGSIPAGFTLAANDDPGTLPGTTAYRVFERIEGIVTALYLRVEAGAGPIDLPSRAAGIVVEQPDLFQRLAGRGVPHGYAPLDGDARVPLTNLPDIASGGGIPPRAFTQAAPASVWGPFVHSVGIKPSSVALFSLDFSAQYGQFTVQHLDDSTLRISMDTPTAGVALIGW